MSFKSSNNKSQGSRRYTTRQIMELTEKRRKQMDEEARLRKLLAPLSEESEQKPEQVLESPKIQEDPDRIAPKNESRPQESSFQIDELSENSILKIKNNGKIDEASPTASQLHCENLNYKKDSPTSETQKTESINEDLQEVKDVRSEAFNQSCKKSTIEAKISERQNVENQDAQVIQFKFPQQRVLQILEVVFISLSLGLIALLLGHLLTIGWSQHFYDQGPFVLMIGLAMIWLNRKNLKIRKEWFWGSVVIVAGGLGVFIAAALAKSIYIELTGFIIVCLGLMLWRYQEECACRFFLPLTVLFFLFAPPIAWEQALIDPFNHLVYHISAWAVNSFHIPVSYDGRQFHVAGVTVFFQGDPTVFRSLNVGILLSVICLSFQNLATAWSILLFVSAVVWTFLANILRVTVTGLVLENLGLEYAVSFFSDHSTYVVLIVMLAGIALTAGVLPHKEDFE